MLALKQDRFTKTDLILRDMSMPGKAAFIVGGQWGSEAKGCAAAWLASEFNKRGECPYNVITTNAGAQAGHTSTHKGERRVVFHLPTVPLIVQADKGRYHGIVYLNAGSVIDPEGLKKELSLYDGELFIHPMAAIITEDCREAEGKAGSAQTKIASTRKGVGEAIARKALRSGLVAKDFPSLKRYVRRLDLNLLLRQEGRILVEVPQGVSLSLNHSSFYPHTTSRDCTPSAALSDAGVHPSFYGATTLVLRTYPIRVGNIVEGDKTLGVSGGHYPDQEEVSWEQLGVEAEITTVTKRVRRVFTFSKEQLYDVMALTRPDVIFLTFCNYAKPFYLDDIEHEIKIVAQQLWMPPPRIVFEYGPTTEDVREEQ